MATQEHTNILYLGSWRRINEITGTDCEKDIRHLRIVIHVDTMVLDNDADLDGAIATSISTVPYQASDVGSTLSYSNESVVTRFLSLRRDAVSIILDDIPPHVDSHLTWWRGLLHQRMKTKQSTTPTRTHQR
jgi:hypothetical protein